MSTVQDQFGFKKIGQATDNVTNGLTADVNTYALAYGSTWSSAAQNPDNFPKSYALMIDRLAAKNLKLRFLVADSDNDSGTVTIWRADGPSCAPMKDLVVTATAGSAVCNKLPGTMTDISNFRYADTLSITTDNVSSIDFGTDGDNGIREISYDLRGGLYLFCDFDMDASGTAGTDMIVLAKVF